MADSVESVTEALLSRIISTPLIRASQKGPRPELPYAVYQVSARRTVGSDAYGRVDDNGLMPVKGVREGTIMVNFFGDAAGEHADNLVNSLRKPTSRWLMRSLHLVITETGPVRDITTLRDDATFEPAANVDLSFRHTANYSDDAGIIETTDVTGAAGNETIHEIITVKITEN